MISPSRLFYPCSFFFRRKDSLWVYGTMNGEFRDNSKYMYLWMCCFHPEIESVWFTKHKNVYEALRKAGFNVVLKYSLRGFYYALRAKVYICTHNIRDILYVPSGGCFYVQLWHGVGIKKLNIGSTFLISKYKKITKTMYRIFRPDVFVVPDLFLGTSLKMKEHFSKVFSCPRENVIQGAYPRLEFFFNSEFRYQLGKHNLIPDFFLGEEHDLHAYGAMILYVPTFRDGKIDFFPEAIPDFNLLNEILRKNKSLLIIRAHPEYIPCTGISGGKKYSNIAYWPDGYPDVYPYLSLFKVLVTDYSSILYDAIFLQNMQIIVYCFDVEAYNRNSREFIHPFKESITGMVALNFDEFLIAIEKSINTQITDEEMQNRRRLIDLFWGRTPHNASAHIYEEITKRLQQKSPER